MVAKASHSGHPLVTFCVCVWGKRERHLTSGVAHPADLLISTHTQVPTGPPPLPLSKTLFTTRDDQDTIDTVTTVEVNFWCKLTHAHIFNVILCKESASPLPPQPPTQAWGNLGRDGMETNSWKNGLWKFPLKKKSLKKGKFPGLESRRVPKVYSCNLLRHNPGTVVIAAAILLMSVGCQS